MLIMKNIKKKMVPLGMFCIVLLGLAYFPYIPILMLRLVGVNYDVFDITTKAFFNFFCDIGYIIILFLIYKEKVVADFKKFFKKFGSNFELSFKYYFIGLIVMIASNLIITVFFNNATAGNEEAVRELIDNLPLYMLFSVSIYAPITEELIFRHAIKDAVLCYGNKKLVRFIYIFISAFIFAAMHILGQTSNAIDYIYIIPYMSLGVAFAALYSKTDNIFSSIMMHALHNTATVILYFMAGGLV